MDKRSQTYISLPNEEVSWFAAGRTAARCTYYQDNSSLAELSEESANNLFPSWNEVRPGCWRITCRVNYTHGSIHEVLPKDYPGLHLLWCHRISRRLKSNAAQRTDEEHCLRPLSWVDPEEDGVVIACSIILGNSPGGDPSPNILRRDTSMSAIVSPHLCHWYIIRHSSIMATLSRSIKSFNAFRPRRQWIWSITNYLDLHRLRQ